MSTSNPAVPGPLDRRQSLLLAVGAVLYALVVALVTASGSDLFSAIRGSLLPVVLAVWGGSLLFADRARATVQACAGLGLLFAGIAKLFVLMLAGIGPDGGLVEPFTALAILFAVVAVERD